MPNRELRDKLIILAAIAVLVWVAVLASYRGTETFMLGMTLHEFLLSVFTLMLVVVGALQTLQLARTNKSAAIVERAYVKMSHVSPPGWISFPDGTFAVQLRVRNHGRTPAKVTEVLLTYEILPRDQLLPEVRFMTGHMLGECPEHFWSRRTSISICRSSEPSQLPMKSGFGRVRQHCGSTGMWTT
jgi:hypothetical protein